MRGAVSVALVYAYYDPNGTTTDRPRSTLISMTLTVVLISTLAFGAVTKPLLDILLGSKGGALSGGGGGDCCGSDGTSGRSLSTNAFCQDALRGSRLPRAFRLSPGSCWTAKERGVH